MHAQKRMQQQVWMGMLMQLGLGLGRLQGLSKGGTVRTTGAGAHPHQGNCDSLSRRVACLTEPAAGVQLAALVRGRA